MFCDGDFSTARLSLEPGDTLFLYTDGFSEANCGDGVEYGVERASRSVHQHSSRQPGELISGCIEDLNAFTAGAPLLDDLTLLAIQRA
jgi:sigma-B regulation protein RsbU (phosphoserine phosphatase)